MHPLVSATGLLRLATSPSPSGLAEGLGCHTGTSQGRLEQPEGKLAFRTQGGGSGFQISGFCELVKIKKKKIMAVVGLLTLNFVK